MRFFGLELFIHTTRVHEAVSLCSPYTLSDDEIHWRILYVYGMLLSLLPQSADTLDRGSRLLDKRCSSSRDVLCIFRDVQWSMGAEQSVLRRPSHWPPEYRRQDYEI